MGALRTVSRSKRLMARGYPNPISITGLMPLLQAPVVEDPPEVFSREPRDPPSAIPMGESAGGGGANSGKSVLGIVLVGVGATLVLILILVCLHRRWFRKDKIGDGKYVPRIVVQSPSGSFLPPFNASASFPTASFLLYYSPSCDSSRTSEIHP
ncbi:unnamed protein product [Darwinula stevensoni]|uniref:Uncharacterized protein n=1 Tax=Darwinula stevensoni TaxID=69355 RepID=A0A7R8X547_9CRUS|nr:unnamed protein product [Darwinula stevensoni]CAG0886270.1 unnamed protein product [Darwinula stevensoni]